eukprot:7377949-Prymnesium_polylepis.1
MLVPVCLALAITSCVLRLRPRSSKFDVASRRTYVYLGARTVNSLLPRSPRERGSHLSPEAWLDKHTRQLAIAGRDVRVLPPRRSRGGRGRAVRAQEEAQIAT